VRNRPTWAQRFFCPVNVLVRRKPCSVVSNARKPLSLWSKPGLSTDWARLYYHYQFIYLFKLTNTRKRLRVEKGKRDKRPAIASASRSESKALHCSTVFLSSGRKWQGQNRRKKNDNILPTSRMHAEQTSSGSKIACKILRLWKNACISTAANVQKPVFFSLNRFCPRSVQPGYNAFPAHPAARKPLML
jgi:hypothetical protein